MASIRQQKISSLVQRELALIFQREGSQKYSGAMVTVSEISVTTDLSIAKVYVSLFTKLDKQEILKEIKSNSKYYKHELAKILRHHLRKMPDFQFYLDDTLDYNEEIDRLLKQ